MMMQSYTQSFPARGVSPQFNQLFFNLNQPSNIENAAIKFHKPGPIIVEKLTENSINRKETPRDDQPLKMSVVSEEKLSIAVRLAKRDLMQKRFSQDHLVGNHDATPRKPAKEKKRGTTKAKVSSHRTDAKGESNNNKQNTAVLTKINSRSSTTKSKGFILESNHNSKRLSREHPEKEERPRNVATPSPGSGLVHQDQDSKQAQEIKRLRKELGHYIQKIEGISRKGSSAVKDRLINDQDLDEDAERRKHARAVEQASRSARLLYALQQQVREIKDDLDRIGPSQIRHTRKSRALHRLAAAHRGAVRALQTFIQQLPGQAETPTSGQPPMYQELGLLIRQLSLCCSRMEIGGNGVPDNILGILQEAAEFQGNAEGLNTSSRKQLDNKRKTNQMHKSVMTRKKNGVSSRPFINKDLPVRDTDVFRATAHKADEVPAIRDTNRPDYDRLQEDKEFTMMSERDYALRTKLEALIRAKDVHKQVASSGRVGNSNRPRLRHSSPGRYKTSKKTSVLLPATSKRLKKKEPQKQTVDDVHFTNATIASKLKTREIVKPTDNPLPPWSPGGIPRRIDSDLDNDGSVASNVKSPLNSPRSSPRRDPRLSPRRSPRPSPRSGTARRKVHFEEEEDDGELNRMMSEFVEKEVARQAWLDNETEKKASAIESQRSKEIDRLTSEVIQEAEEAVRRKVQPLIEHHQHQTIEEQLHVGGHEEDGMLENEAEQLHQIEDEILMEERALDLQEEPALEKLLQRLEEMETEEDIIRRRLQKISYSSCNEDAVKNKQHEHEDDGLLTLKGTPLEGAQLESMSMDVPVEHTSLQFTKNRKDNKVHKPQVRYRLPKNSSPDTEDPESNSFRTAGMIMFGDHSQDANLELGENDCKHRNLKSDTSTHSNHSNKTNAATRTQCSSALLKPCTTLSIPHESRRKIEECRGRFEQHLKKTSHHTYGAFNPWKLVEEVSDEIVNELLEGVSDEIGSMTEVFVENVYKREFGTSSSKPSSQEFDAFSSKPQS